MKQFAAVLVGKLARAAPLRWSGAGVAAIVAAFVLLVIGVSAFTLNGPQAAERSLGGFDFATSDSVALADDLHVGVLQQVRHAAERAGATARWACGSRAPPWPSTAWPASSARVPAGSCATWNRNGIPTWRCLTHRIRTPVACRSARTRWRSPMRSPESWANHRPSRFSLG